MAITGNRAVVEQLLADGFSHMFGNPGTVEQGLLDALGDYPDLRYILGLQETVCVAMADGYARATGGPALVQLHTGVGLGNGVGMLYQALRGHSPLVVIAGDSGVRYESFEAQMAVDLVAMAKPVTKYATRVTDPNSVLRVLRRAVRIAMTPPRGPVFVALPADVLDEDNTETVIPTVFPRTESVPVPRLLREAAELLAPARRPVILIGDGVAASDGAAERVGEFAEQWGAEVWGVDSGELNIPGRHPLYRGQLGHMFGHQTERRLAGADAVLVVGTYLFPEVYPGFEPPFAPGTPIVHLDLDAQQIAKNHPVTLGLVADPAAGLAGLAAELGLAMSPAAKTHAADRFLAAGEQAALTATQSAPDTVADRFFAAVARATPPGLLLFDEALTASDTMARHLPPGTPGTWFQTRGGSLGVGVPGALGVKLAHPDRPVLAATGDGGVMYTIQALAAAARYGIGAKFVVCNNGRYRLLDHNLDEYRSGHGQGPRPQPAGFDLSPHRLDFVGLARAQGVDGAKVHSFEEVEPAVRRMFADDRPFLVDLLTERSPGNGEETE